MRKNIIMMSGDWPNNEREFAKKAGCKILEKPFELEKLSELLEECKRETNPNRKLVDLDH